MDNIAEAVVPYQDNLVIGKADDLAARLKSANFEPEAKLNIWREYDILFQFTSPVYGSWPLSRDVLERFVETSVKRQKVKPVDMVLSESRGVTEIRREKDSVEETLLKKIAEAEETLPPDEAMDEEIERRTLGFRQMNGVYVFQGGTLRSHIKDCARQLSSHVILKGQGERSLNVRGTNGLYVKEDWVPLFRSDGELVTKHDLEDEFFVHTTNPKTGAPMSSIKRCQGLEPGVCIRFTLLDFGDIVSREELYLILQYGGIHGYGQERSRGAGRYQFDIQDAGNVILLPKKAQKPTLEQTPKSKQAAAKKPDSSSRKAKAA